MADTNSFDCAATNLVCDEETKGLCFDDDDVETFNEESYQKNGEKEVICDSEAFVHLPCMSEECIGWMVDREKEHLPRDDYVKRLRSGELDRCLRREALDWMLKACAHYNFGELCLYLAMSYFDRFLSVYELPVSSFEMGGKKWAIQLVAVACLSLAAKIEEVNVPSTVDLQAGESKFFFEGKTVHRMEIILLNCLQWKIKAYTPCNFIDYYLRMMNGGELPFPDAIHRSLDIILSTIEGIEFLEFRPSEIAAAVAMYVSDEIQSIDSKAMSGFIGTDKGRVMKCLEVIQELRSSVGGISNFNITAAASPNGVLDAACLSYKSDERAVGSCSNSLHTTPETKRRKLYQSSSTLGGHS